jgi:hypothetical protein
VLTHVCRAWRQAFISRSSLWTDLECRKLNADKTRVYLERSKSSPINLRLDEGGDLSPHNPFLQIVPHAIGRLKSLIVNATPRNLPAITAHLSQPSPFLGLLSINGNHEFKSERNPVLTTVLFNDDFPSLRELRLQSVRTELPWRNMVNLTSFELGRTHPDHVPIRQLLDFFESAPRLRKIRLFFATPTSGAQNDRLVSLACLRWMHVAGEGPPSLLLDHLIIPAGAELITRTKSHGPPIDNLLPRSLNNLRNLSNFTKIHLDFSDFYPHIQFSGPNGQVHMFLSPLEDPTHLTLEFLARFDTSKTEWLKIDNYYFQNDPPFRELLPMKHLRTLTITRCGIPDVFIHVLDPSMSSSEVVVCPKLEELVLVLHANGETIDIKNVIAMAAARASRGAKLKSVRIVTQDKSVQIDALELKRYVLNVECGPGDDVADEETDAGDEED